MATEALRILADGTTEKININDIGKEDRDVTYICSGKTNGKLCGIKMIPVFGETPYFRSAPDCRHICDCPFDESETAVIKRHLDVTGSKTTIETLLSAFSKGEKQARKKQVSQGTGAKTAEKDAEKQEKEESRRIIREARDPRNLKELCALLTKTDLDEPYAGIPVRDSIVDHRTVKAYREHGLSDEQMAVVLCGRISKDRLDKCFPGRAPQAIVLRDAFSFEDKAAPLLFELRTGSAVKQKIFAAPSDHIIAVFAQWHPHPTNPRTYFCDQIQVGQVFAANKDFFDTSL